MELAEAGEEEEVGAEEVHEAAVSSVTGFLQEPQEGQEPTAVAATRVCAGYGFLSGAG